MAKRRTVWTASLHGKWGGSRRIEVEASSESVARKLARQLARLDESVQSVHDTGRVR